MLRTVWGVVRGGRIELLERVDLPEGSTVLVTLLPDETTLFWMRTSQIALDKVWDNPEDDIYAQLLEVGTLTRLDADRLERSLRDWLGLP